MILNTNTSLFSYILKGILLIYSLFFLGCGSVSKETSSLEMATKSIETASYSSVHTNSDHNFEISVLSNWVETASQTPFSLVLFSNSLNSDELFCINTPQTPKLNLEIELKAIKQSLTTQGKTATVSDIKIKGISGKMIQYKTVSQENTVYISRLYIDHHSKRYSFHYINNSESIAHLHSFLSKLYFF